MTDEEGTSDLAEFLLRDKPFSKDPRHGQNRRFLEKTAEKATSIYNLLELCGIASFTVTTTELTTLFTNCSAPKPLHDLFRSIPEPSMPTLVLPQLLECAFEIQALPIRSCRFCG